MDENVVVLITAGSREEAKLKRSESELRAAQQREADGTRG